MKAPTGLLNATLVAAEVRTVPQQKWSRAVRDDEKMEGPRTDAGWSMPDRDDDSIVVGEPATLSVEAENLSHTVDRPAVQGDEPRSSEIVTFESVRQNEDYRGTLLGVKNGVDFLDSQELVHDGGRPHGKHVVPSMRVTTVIEKLTNKDEPWGFKAETDDGSELVGKVNNEKNGRVLGSRINGLEEMDLLYPPLPAAIFPAERLIAEDQGLPLHIIGQDPKV